MRFSVHGRADADVTRLARPCCTRPCSAIAGTIDSRASITPSEYRFTVDRKGEHPASHLAGYQGWMHADGYSGFNELYRSGDVKEVACMAHVRRKFVDVF